MKLHHFHIHLDSSGIEFQNITNDFQHAIYRSRSSGKAVTIPKNQETLTAEYIVMACLYIGIEIPVEIEKMMDKN